MNPDILFETNRFNLSEVKEGFINPCCFGEDVAAWLRSALLEKGLKVIEPNQEDWGWYIEANYRGNWHFVGIGGNADESGADRNQGEWRIMTEKSRSIWEKLTGTNKLAEDDELLALILEILETQPDFKNVRYERDAPNNSSNPPSR